MALVESDEVSKNSTAFQQQRIFFLDDFLLLIRCFVGGKRDIVLKLSRGLFFSLCSSTLGIGHPFF